MAVVRTTKNAIAWSKGINKGYKGLCLVFVRNCFNVAAKYPTAADSWKYATKKHESENYKAFPVGAPIHFKVPGLPAGHVALYLGDGKMRTNVSHLGTVETRSVSWYLDFANATVLGWTEDLNGVIVWKKPVVVAKPKPPAKDKLYLPKTANKWAVYKTSDAPVAKNAHAFLNPMKFDGLDYEILGEPQKDVVTIKTAQFGKVNIYVGKGTGAVIK